MKVNEVNIIYSRTVQMRQFEPATVSVSIKAQVDPGEPAINVIKTIKRLAKEQVETERDALLNERQESYENDKEKSA
jgi:hypothetical protein